MRRSHGKEDGRGGWMVHSQYTKTRDVLPTFPFLHYSIRGWAGGGLKMSSLTTIPTMERKRSMTEYCFPASFHTSSQRYFSNIGRKMRKLPLIHPTPDRNDTTTENIGNILSLAQCIFSLETLDIFHREHSQRGGKERGRGKNGWRGSLPHQPPIGRASSQFLPPSEHI